MGGEACKLPDLLLPLVRTAASLGKEVRVHVLALHAGPPRPAPQTHQWTADAGRAGPDGTPWNHEPNE